MRTLAELLTEAGLRGSLVCPEPCLVCQRHVVTDKGMLVSPCRKTRDHKGKHICQDHQDLKLYPKAELPDTWKPMEPWL